MAQYFGASVRNAKETSKLVEKALFPKTKTVKKAEVNKYPDKKIFKYGIPLLIVDLKNNKFYAVMNAANLKLIQFTTNEDKTFIAYDKTKCEIIAICAFDPNGFSHDIKINDLDKTNFAHLIENYNRNILNDLTIKITPEIAEFALNTWYPKEIKAHKKKNLKELTVIRNVTPNDLDKYLKNRESFYPVDFNYNVPKASKKFDVKKLEFGEDKINTLYSQENKETINSILKSSVILENIKKKKNKKKNLIASIVSYFNSIKTDLARFIMLKDYYKKFEKEQDLKIKEEHLKWIIKNLFESEKFSEFYKIENNKIIINEEFKDLMEKYLW